MARRRAERRRPRSRTAVNSDLVRRKRLDSNPFSSLAAAILENFAAAGGGAAAAEAVDAGAMDFTGLPGALGHVVIVTQFVQLV